jgi:FtsP/CotA-like multicopper oxidase with cupredoxin domain
MKKRKFILGILVVLSLFVFACTAQEGVNDDLDQQLDSGINDDVVDDVTDNIDDVVDDVTLDGDVKTFNVVGGPMFEFFVDDGRNADIVVNVGDTVRIVYESAGGMPHDFVVDEIDGARTQIWQPGQGEIIEFVANVAGEFEYYCSVGSHRAQGMVGNFIVLE